MDIHMSIMVLLGLLYTLDTACEKKHSCNIVKWYGRQPYIVGLWM